MVGYVKNFDNYKTISFNATDNRLLRKYNKIWKKVSRLMDIKLDGEPVFGDNDKYIKSKIMLYGDDDTNTNFQKKGIPKENVPCKRLSVIMLDSVIRVNKKYYSQTLLDECKYETKKKKIENFINDDLDSSSSDESDNDGSIESDKKESHD